MGLLPVIADGVHVGIPRAGMLVTAYAVGVMAGAPVMTLLFSRFGRRAALMALMVIFTVGNLMSALAPGYLQNRKLAAFLQEQGIPVTSYMTLAYGKDMGQIAALERNGREVDPEGLAPTWD